MYRTNELAVTKPLTPRPVSPEARSTTELPSNGDFGKQGQTTAGRALSPSTSISRSPSGVELATLSAFDTIVVETVTSQYQIFVLDPKTGRALLQGGQQFDEPVEGWVIGSSDAGAVVRTGWIEVGMNLQAWVDDKYVRTSAVQALWVAHQPS